MKVIRFLRKAWKVGVLSFVVGALPATGIYLKYEAQQLEMILKEYHRESSPPLSISSLLHPLQLDRPAYYIFSRQIIGYVRQQHLHFLVTLAADSEIQLIYEQGQGQYCAFQAVYEADQVSFQAVSYEQEHEVSARPLRSFGAGGRPATLAIMAEITGNTWNLKLNDEVLGTAPALYGNNTDIGLRLIKGRAVIHEIGIKLSDQVTGTQDARSYAFPMGSRLFSSPSIALVALAGGLLFALSNLGWVWLIAATVKIRLSSAFLIDWCNHLPLFLLIPSVTHLTKADLALSLLAVAVMKLWSCVVVSGSKPPKQCRGGARRFRLLIVITSVVASLTLAITFLAGSREVQAGKPKTSEVNEWVDLGNGLLFSDFFEHGIVECTVRFEPDSAFELFFRRIRHMPESDQRYGVLLSSDSQLPCEVTEVIWDKINHWPMEHLAVMPAGKPLNLKLAIIGDRLQVFVNERLVQDASGYQTGEGRVGIIPVRGRAFVSRFTITKYKVTPSDVAGRQSAAYSLQLPGIALLTALALSCVSRLPRTVVFSQCLAAMLPAELLRFGMAAAGLISWYKWSGVALMLGNWLFVYLVVLLVIAQRSWFRQPWIVIGALLLTTPGFIEDVLTRWLPDRELYMKDSYHLNAKCPVPHGAEWYFVPRLRYTNDYYDLHYFRGRRYPLQKPDNTTRIVCLGGSTVACTDRQVGARQDWSAQLEDRLNRFPERHYEVINAGVQGYATLHVWYWFEAVVRNFHPDVVILSSVFNNHLDFALTTQQQQFDRIACDPGGWFSAWRYYLDNTRLVMLARRQLVELAHYRLHWKVPAADDLEYKLQLKRFVLASRQQGFELITVQEPSFELYLSPDELGESIQAIRSYHDILSREAARCHLTLVDVRDRFRSMSQQELFTDVVHLTDYGNRLLAEDLELAVRQVMERLPQE